MRTKTLSVDADRVVLTEARAARTKYLELDADDVSDAEAADEADWGPSPKSSASASPAAPSSPQGTSPPSSSSSSWRRIAFNKKKDKNEPSRFMGEGVSFKAKLIGILEVAEARGDRMCQDALADLKMAIRAAGEHKQRITINIAIDGLRLRDEKTGDCLYHHLVHKISFIAQDMTDPRAFGYIFGSPDTGHRFFGIKTDKAASQVVECIRDLFQVVFALKNREQHVEQHHLKICGASTASLMSSTTTPSVTYMEAMQHHLNKESVRENGSPGAGAASSSKAESEATIADLLDLEYELNNLQSNMHHMSHHVDPHHVDHLMGSRPSDEDEFGADPFGDSFAATVAARQAAKASAAAAATSSAAPVAVLPPPPSAKDSVKADGTHRRERASNRAASTTSAGASSTTSSHYATTPMPAPLAQEEKHWFDQETEALFDDAELTQTMPNTGSSRLDQDANRVSPLELLSRQAALTDQFDVFTELDPLGTGRSKPYVDKKDFFSDLKNPPKKVLKDLVDPLSVVIASTGTTASASNCSNTTPLFQTSFDKGSRDVAGPSAGPQPDALGDVLSALESGFAPGGSTSFPAFPDPFSDDPFDKTDPFAEGSFSQTVSFSPNTVMPDPFETGFADFSSFPPGSRNSTSPLQTSSASAGSSVALHGHGHGPLRVSLPPEEGAASAASTSCLSPSPPLSGSLSKPRNRLGRKQLSVSLVKIPSPKSSQRRSRLSKQVTVDGSTTARFPPLGSSPTPPLDDSSSTGSQQRRSPGGLSRGVITPSPPIVASFPDLDGDAGSRLSGSSAELAEIAPEPPPRPAPNNAFSIKPPPLPPKKHTGAIYKPPPRPPHQDDSIYDHIENYESSSSPTPHDLGDALADAKSPPIPVPARKPRYGDDNSLPLRPKKQNVLAETEDGYLAPIPFLPPPVKRHQSGHARKAGQQVAPPAQGGPAAPAKKSLDITLSQLTKTGFSDLATTLGISPSQLSKMTLQDLTKRLASLSDPSAPQDAFTAGNRSSLSKAEYTALRESVDEDSGFAAEFDDNFCNLASATASSSAAAESLFDKYAVFRELLLQDDKARADEPQNDLSATKVDVREEDDDEEDAQDAPLAGLSAGLSAAVSSVPHSSPITIHVAQPDSASASPSPAQAMSDTPLDRYAALREIALGDESSTKEDDEDARDEDNHAYAEVDNESDKDDSMTEVIHEAMAVQDEDQDLLTLSAQHSESTESPTLDTNTVRDAPSIMETTILEEDAPSEGDGEQVSGQPRTSLLDASIVSLEPVPENLELSSKSLLPSLVNGAAASEHTVKTPAAPVSAMTAKTPAADPAPSSRPHSLEAKAGAEPWAKFDSSQFEKPVSDEGASPWSSDGKEFIKGSVSGWKDDSDHERRDKGRDKGRRRRPNRGPGPPAGSAAWAEDEESEEGWDDRVSDDPWENGFDEGQGRPGGRYPEPRRSRRRKVSPWRRGAGSSSGKQSSREVSPWESGESTGPPPGPPPGDDMKRGWKSRSKNRESSWEEDRALPPRVPGSTGPGSGGPGSGRGSWDGDGSEYEDARKRRQSPWGEDRDRERERRHAWEEGEWYGQAREAREGWDWHYRDKERDHRDDEYRRRWEYERGRDRDWEWDRYGRPRKPGPGSHYRDQSWDDELSEQGDDDRGPRGPHGPPGRKWRRSRPGSAASRGHERVSPSTSIEYKEDDSPGPCPPTSATAPRRRGYHDRDWERDRDRERERDRDRMGGSMDRRSRSRDDPFSSDQEHEYWERGERTRSRTERGDPRYDQRSQTLYARRANRARYKTYDQSFAAKQSPFEDDFSSQRFDFVIEPKQSSTSFSQESSLDASEPNRSPLPASVHVAHPGHAAAPGLRPQSGSASSRLRDSLSESEEARAAEGGLGGLGASLSPLERGGSGRGRASSIGSSRRQSPFEDDFTPPNSAGARHLSSASSDISDQHRFDDAPPGLGSRPGSGRTRTAPIGEARDPRDPDARSNGRSMDDVFLPADVGRAHSSHTDALPADATAEPVISPNRPPPAVSSEHRRSVRISGEDKNLAGMKARLANLRRTDSSSSLRKSESINIFARSCDPFDDDDFFAEDGSVATAPGGSGRAEHPGQQGHPQGHPARPAGDQYKWTEAFDSFNFEEEH